MGVLPSMATHPIIDEVFLVVVPDLFADLPISFIILANQEAKEA